MHRRVPHTPEIDMTSMMGLSAILIVLLLTASAPPYAAIKTELPGIGEEEQTDPPVVPTVGITRSGAWLQVGDTDRVKIDTIDAVADALVDVRSIHSVDGSWRLIPDSDVPYDDVIRIIDVARTAEFDSVSFGGGLVPTSDSP